LHMNRSQMLDVEARGDTVERSPAISHSGETTKSPPANRPGRGTMR
jgi:hypothetical protein